MPAKLYYDKSGSTSTFVHRVLLKQIWNWAIDSLGIGTLLQCLQNDCHKKDYPVLNSQRLEDAYGWLQDLYRVRVGALA